MSLIKELQSINGFSDLDALAATLLLCGLLAFGISTMRKATIRQTTFELNVAKAVPTSSVAVPTVNQTNQKPIVVSKSKSMSGKPEPIRVKTEPIYIKASPPNKIVSATIVGKDGREYPDVSESSGYPYNASDGTPLQVKSAPIIVQTSDLPYYRERGWRKIESRLTGYYRCKYGAWKGMAEKRADGRYQFYIYDVPYELLNGSHRACFTKVNNDGLYHVHFTGDSLDVNASITAVERLLTESLKPEN